MKKALLLSATLLLVIITNAQIVNIPDANFKAALLAHNPVIDTNGDDEIQVTEAEAFTETVDVFSENISELTGIEAFINITGLNCDFNQLTNLDLSNNNALTELFCKNNQLTSLVFGDNISNMTIVCRDNQLTSLDVSTCINLYSLICSYNDLTSLDLSNNTNLSHIYCGANQLVSLDLPSNDIIVELSCSSNHLTALDLSNHSSLSAFYCPDNQLTSLNVKNGHNHILEYFSSENNPNLTCVEVDNVQWSNSNWTLIDAQTSFSTDCTDGIADIETLTGLTISPNPFTDRVEVALEKHSDYEIRLLDILGKELLATQFNGTSYTLSTSELPKGTYLMHISSNDGVRVEKVVKQ